MPRLVMEKRSPLEEGIERLAKTASQRIVSMPAGQCPLDFTLSLTRLYLSESCGKCTPCRIGLLQIANLLDSALAGEADENTVPAIRRVAQTILDTADCAIGFESARMVLSSLDLFADDYASHAETGCCQQKRSSYIPCQGSCPAHIDIPGYIALVREGRYVDALRVIRNDNPLPAVCGYVCEHPCEFSCRRTLVDDAINICGLKRFADDHADVYRPQPNQASTGKRVGIIGGGPAGLTTAYYLQLMGHDVTIYEQREKLGGMLRYGIPDYRLPQYKLDRDIDYILSTGIRALTGTSVGTDLSYAELVANYDALYLAIGAHMDKKLDCEGEDGEGVISAVTLLRRIAEGDTVDFKGKHVTVIGGGNVAMDCTRTARRLGAESVECLYRRRIEDMTALAEEIEEALAEGCQITELEAPVRIETDEQNRVAALITQPQIIGPIGRDGRPRPQAADAPERRVPCDIVIVAIGQAIDTAAFTEAVSTERGKIVASEDGSIANAEGVFAGGDAVSGPATVILAIAGGKVAAANIDAALGYRHDVYDDVSIPLAHASLPPTGRVDLRDRRFSESAKDFDIAKLGMSRQEAEQESARCLRCDHYGFGAVFGEESRAW